MPEVSFIAASIVRAPPSILIRAFPRCASTDVLALRWRAAANYASVRGVRADAARTPSRECARVFQVRIHGRGGQGVVTAAELLSVAAFDDGRHAQAFPVFGSERTGAPVMAFCRIDERPIRTREPVMAPDALVIQD